MNTQATLLPSATNILNMKDGYRLYPMLIQVNKCPCFLVGSSMSYRWLIILPAAKIGVSSLFYVSTCYLCINSLEITNFASLGHKLSGASWLNFSNFGSKIISTQNSINLTLSK